MTVTVTVNWLKFWGKVTVSEGCWEWSAGHTKKGYGAHMVVLPNGKKTMWYAHRLSWRYFNGEIPDLGGHHGGCICHTCDNMSCVRPSHLFLGTIQDNLLDMRAKGRASGNKTRGRNRKGGLRRCAK